MSSDRCCTRCGAPLTREQAESGECPACLIESVSTSPRAIATGSWIGPYRVVRELGQGGMGVVYLAEQQEPIRRQVALKVIRRGMDTRQVVARFETERQALALMDHPSIARVYDAGETDEGRPFFAMEYVDGEPLVAFCDREKLDTRERLALFVQVCDGIQHAHRRGIIHRDIKPSNILVSKTEDGASPTIIDFGVAKAIEQRLSERQTFTELGVLLGTPEYMSPEQADLAPENVDTRTDVYSLGVLLYELLTGALPFESAELRAAAFDEIRRRVREEVPSLPSARLRTLDTAVGAATARGSDVPSLCREIAGDLDAIAMKALEKEPSRRYESPSELRADVERHLKSEPVLARPPSSLYQLRKWVSRHRVPAALAGLLLASIVAFGAGMTVLYARASAAESRAEREAEAQRRVADFMVRSFQLADPNEARGNQVTVREMLDEAASKIESELADDPLVRARMTAAMGAVYRNLGLSSRGEALTRAALGSLRELEGERAPDTLRAERDLGIVLRDLDRADEAAAILSANADAFEALLGPESPEALESRRHLGRVYLDQGRFDDAERILRDVLAIQERRSGRESEGAMVVISDLAHVLMDKSSYPEAESLLDEVIESRTRLSGPDHPLTLSARFNRATVAERMTSGADAAKQLEDLLADAKRVWGEEHFNTLRIANRLGISYQYLDRVEESEALFREVIDLQRRAGRSDNHVDTLNAETNLASLYEYVGRLDEAVEILPGLIERSQKVLGEDHPDVLGTMNNLGNVYLKLRRAEEAEAIYRTALDSALPSLGERNELTLRVMSNLGLLIWGPEREEESIEMLTRTLELQREVLGETNRQVGITAYNLCQMHWVRKEYERSDEVFQVTQDSWDATYGETHERSRRVMTYRIQMLRESGEDEKADRLAKMLADREARAQADG